MKTIGIIVPCYNEAAVLPMFYKETSAVMDALADRYRTEFVFVDDGSRDETLNRITDLSMTDARVKYISFSRNFGKEAAMLAGMEYAVKHDYICIIDADLQHSPEIIPQMLDYVENQGYDVAASRRADREGEEKFKSFLSGSFYKVINKISETKISDSAQDFRVMKRDVVKAILSMPEHNRFSKGIFTWVGFNVKWISHENRERAAGETKWSLSGLLKYAIDGILGFTFAPLKLPFLLAGLLFIAALAALLYGVIKNIAVPEYTLLLPLILAAVFVTGAALLLCVGILGQYLARTYTEVVNRPKYIIAKTNTNVSHYTLEGVQ